VTTAVAYQLSDASFITGAVYIDWAKPELTRAP
jgi:hypothetical protein